MGMSRQRLLPILLTLLAITAWWLGRMRDEPPRLDDGSQGQPDHTINGLRATTLDENGRPHRRLVAREARHYPDNAGSELDEPRLTLFPETGPPWLLKSERGWVSEKAEEVILRGDVHLDREASRENPPWQVETQVVFIWPNDKYARTEHPLRAVSGPNWLNSASGGEAWFGETLRARLFGRVSLEYRHKPGQAPQPEPDRDPAYQVSEERP